MNEDGRNTKRSRQRGDILDDEERGNVWFSHVSSTAGFPELSPRPVWPSYCVTLFHSLAGKAVESDYLDP
jgi:hypothetical protein